MKKLKHWERDINSRADPHTLRFLGGSIVYGVVQDKPEPNENNDTGTCPFCLHQGPLAEFAVSTKHGFSRLMGQCPECKKQAHFKTIKRQWKIKEFALWVWKYAYSGFWKKCSYSKFTLRLKLIGQLDNFWNAYNEFRGDVSSEE